MLGKRTVLPDLRLAILCVVILSLVWGLWPVLSAIWDLYMRAVTIFGG
jgi:hypothetical protein